MTERIYSFDPGKTTGVAVGDFEGNLIDTSQWGEQGLWAYLQTINEAAIFIIEEFRIRPDKAQSFIQSEMLTIQLIGALKFRADQLGAMVVMQQPSIKSIGYKWAGIEPPKNHALSHSTDAYAHLSYYWTKVINLEPIVVRSGRLAQKEK